MASKIIYTLTPTSTAVERKKFIKNEFIKSNFSKHLEIK